MARDGLGQLVRAEWTKLRSVRGWGITMLVAVGITVLVSLLGASSSSSINDSEGPPLGPDGTRVADDFHFVHRPISGDATITARVATLTSPEQPQPEWAKAGVMIKQGTTTGSPYAAVMVTPGHGVRLQANFTTEVAHVAGAAPTWLRLTRAGSTITGYRSDNGADWHRMGSVTLQGLPQTVEVGLFVASPAADRVERGFGGTSSTSYPTQSTATFDGVTVTPAPAGEWRSESIGQAEESEKSEATGSGFTVTGSGDVAPLPAADDVTQLSLTGVHLGLIAIVAVAVLFITSEYKRGMIRTTFTASPHRGRVLAAKALVIGAATFAVGLVASFAAFLVAQPILRSNGFAPPAFPVPSLSDPTVLRAVVGTAVVLALIAVFSLGVGTILRRSAGAIALVILLFIAPQLIVGALPVRVAQWVVQAAPSAGFAIQQTTPRYDFMADQCLPEFGCYIDNPWVGFGVLCGYVAASLLLALWLLRRRDA